MDSLRPQQGAYEAQRAQANRQELVERIARAIRDDGRVEPLKGLALHQPRLLCVTARHNKPSDVQ